MTDVLQMLELDPGAPAAPREAAAIGDPKMFVARWELDLSGVTSLLEPAAGDAGREPGWAESLLHGARISELDERAAKVVGAPVEREEMIGQPVAFFAPPDSWQILARLIATVASDSPRHRARSSPINSFMLRGARLTVWGKRHQGLLLRVNVSVEGEIADGRSPWAVRASEERYRRLIHYLPTALLQVDGRGLDAIFQRLRAEGVIDIRPYIDEHPELVAIAREVVTVTDANMSAVQLFNAESAEALTGSVEYLFAFSPECARRVVVAHFEGKRSHRELIKLQTHDGRLLDVQLSVTYPNPPERLDVTLISLEDITDRLSTESELRQLQSDYSRATRVATLGELASSIAHEVNQPLAAIAMNAETSLRWLSRDDPNLPKVHQLTERIAASARHASEIVQRIRGMVSRHVIECADLDLNDVVREALLFVRHDIETRAITLLCNLEPKLPKILGDRVQLQQVIVNLLVNAIQALGQQEKGDRTIELSTGVGPGGEISLMVRDNGPGIAPGDFDRLFDGFFTTKEDGMGIGLAVCQSIALSHGGRISAETHPGGGAIFRFSLGPAPNEI